VYIAFRAIWWAGFICGVLDGLSAAAVFWFFGVKPIRVFQGIAAGLLGSSAFRGGAGSALMGVALHFLVAFGAAAAYFAASRWLPLLVDHALACGVAFGIAVHLFMTFVVIPLSAIGSRPLVLRSFVAVLIVHMLVVGPSISLTVRHYSR
jgi:hypothetical protein